MAAVAPAAGAGWAEQAVLCWLVTPATAPMSTVIRSSSAAATVRATVAEPGSEAGCAMTGRLLSCCRRWRARCPRRTSRCRRHRRERPKSPGSGLIPVTLAEVRRLLAHLITATPRRTAAWAWSTWRRHHQHQARISHYRRRQAVHNELLL